LTFIYRAAENSRPGCDKVAVHMTPKNQSPREPGKVDLLLRYAEKRISGWMERLLEKVVPAASSLLPASETRLVPIRIESRRRDGRIIPRRLQG
jgi:hypothetical protein